MPTNSLAENIEKAGKCKNPAFRRLSKKVASFFFIGCILKHKRLEHNLLSPGWIKISDKS